MQLLAQACDPETLQTWFAPIRPVGVESRQDESGEAFDALVLYVPSESFLRQLLEQHVELLRRVTDEVIGGRLEVVLEPTPEAVRPRPRQVSTSPRMQEYTSHLSADLRFDTFYESACNREALRIAEATAARPGQAPLNFLFIYGPSGVGKTHLCQAIGQRALELHPDLRVSYVATSKFEAQFIRDSLNRGPGRGTFIDFYQQMDVLIIDDIQGLIGKTKTQQAFFDIFNHLYMLGKQIIVTCDVPPIDLKGMETRIMTRIQSAMMLRIDRPELTPHLILETVCRIYGQEVDQLRTSSRKAELALPRQVVMYLVKKHTNASYKAIAKLLNRSDHTTVMHGVKTIEGRIEHEAELRARIAEIETELRA